MLKGLLESLVGEMAGEYSVPIVDILFNKKNVNEFLIAKKMNMTINQVRNVLYKLSAEGLVSFTRKKDKRKGWYIYYWTLDNAKCIVKLDETLNKKIVELKRSLESREKDRFFVCKLCDIELTEEQALEKDFKCEECASTLELGNNEEFIKKLKAKIAEKERHLALVTTELGTIKTKFGKRIAREEKKVKDDKVKKRAEKRAEREKEKKKLLRKEGSKKSKKSKNSKVKVLEKKVEKKVKGFFKQLKKKI